MPDQSTENTGEKKVAAAMGVIHPQINTWQLQRFMLLNIPGQVRHAATCGNMICFEVTAER